MGSAAIATVASLRQILEQRFPDAAPITQRTAEQVGTGIQALDNALPSGGFPRGRLSVWAPHGGATALLRSACFTAVALGERAAWIDGAHTTQGSSWAHGGGPVLLRPRTQRHALLAAEELLRSGGFALVVLDGAEPHGSETVRLTRAAREGGAAFVALTTLTALSSLRLTSSLDPRGYRWRRTPFGEPAYTTEVQVRVDARALGWSKQAQFSLPVSHHESRLSLDPGLADRRGLTR
jgi:hypothetical protein